VEIRTTAKPNQTTISAPLSPATSFLPHPLRPKGGFKGLPPKANSCRQNDRSGPRRVRAVARHLPQGARSGCGRSTRGLPE
jgi:hypothetical protein